MEERMQPGGSPAVPKSNQARADSSSRRLALLFGWSVALHLAAWVLVQQLPPRPRPAPLPRPIDVRIVQVPTRAPAAPQVTPPPVRHSRLREKNLQSKVVAQAPAPVTAPPVARAEPQSVAPRSPGDVSTPEESGETITEGGEEAALAERARGVRLFDPGALGSALVKRGLAQATPDELLAPAQKLEGAAAEKARVGARLAADIEAAELEGQVRGGLISECGDGIDQGLDDEIDCASPGCRMLPVCMNTQVFEKKAMRPIPDDDTLGVFSEIDVPSGGHVRAVSIKVRFAHPSPGDLAIILESPGGQRSIVRRADRGEPRYARAFFVRDLGGQPVPGRWRLRVVDAIRGSTGLFQGWQLVITG
jgi:hypothetical protein